MSLNLQVFLGRISQAEYILDDIGHVYKLGRDNSADIHLPGDRMAASHAIINYEETEGWQLIAEDGEVKVAGKKVSSHKIHHELNASVGPYLLKFVDFNKQADRSFPDSVSLSGSAPIKKIKSAIGTDKSISKIVRQKLTTYHKRIPESVKQVDKRYWLLGVACVVAWIYMGTNYFSGSNDSDSTISTSTTVSNVDSKQNTDGADSASIDQTKTTLSLSDQRIANRYLQWAEQLIEQGDLQQALTSLQAGHKKLPDHNKIKTRLDQLRLDLIDKYQQNGQFEQSLALLEPIKEGFPELQSRYDKLLKQQSEQEISQQQNDKIQAQLRQLDLGFDEDLEQHEYQSIRDKLLSLDQALISSDQALNLLYKNMIKKMEQHEKIYTQAAVEEMDRLAEQNKRSRSNFMRCIKLMQAGEIINAHLACQKAQQEAPEDSENHQEITQWLDYLKQASEKEYDNLVQMAEQCYQQGKIECAFNYWQQILSFDDSQLDIEQRMSDALAIQLEKASDLYKTAKAYEDLGHNEKALIALERLFKVLPLPDQALYQKSQRLKIYLENQ